MNDIFSSSWRSNLHAQDASSSIKIIIIQCDIIQITILNCMFENHEAVIHVFNYCSMID